MSDAGGGAPELAHNDNQPPKERVSADAGFQPLDLEDRFHFLPDADESAEVGPPYGGETG